MIDRNDDVLFIGERIALYRKRRKLSQEQLAKCIGVTKATVSNYETGKTVPDINCIRRIITELQIPLDSILRNPEEYPELILYLPEGGCMIGDDGVPICASKSISAREFEIYKCRQREFCCMKLNGSIYLLHNQDISEKGDTLLARAVGEEQFFLVAYDGEKYTECASGRELDIEEIVAKSLCTVKETE